MVWRSLLFLSAGSIGAKPASAAPLVVPRGRGGEYVGGRPRKSEDDPPAPALSEAMRKFRAMAKGSAASEGGEENLEEEHEEVVAAAQSPRLGGGGGGAWTRCSC